MANNDDDDGFIKFEITDQDLEFGQGNHRSKRMTKNQAIYGIWAESESDDDDGDKKQRKKRTDYTSSVSFVKSDKKLQDEVKDRKPSSSKTNESSRQTHSKKKSTRFSGLGSAPLSSSNADADFGHWEMYTKGVGSKLLQKMGYQPGKGLGKNLQGIIEPIEAKKRPGTGSIGLYGPETTARKLRKGVEDDDDDDDSEQKDQHNNEKKSINEKDWKRNDGMKKIKTIKVYEKSTDDIIRDSVKKSWSNQNDDYLTGMKIIDMTGPQQQILSGLTKLHQSKPIKPKDDYRITEFNTRFDIPELRQNMERLIMLSEKNLVKRKREYDRNCNQIENLNEERERLIGLDNVYQRQLKTIQAIETFIESLEETKHDLSFEKGLENFENFFTKFSTEENDELKRQLRSLKFDTIIKSVFGPIIRRELRTWHPFDNFAMDYSGHFERLRSLILKSKTFELILWQYWLPIVSRSMQTISLKIQFESIIAFVEKWQKILPKWLYEYFIANSLLPKMRSEVDDWNPLTDTISIHSWIHPWLPVLLTTKTSTNNNSEDELNFLFEPIYEIIRSKLSNALKNWHPNDCSARLILEPWKNVFKESSMQSFLEQNIVPKLEHTMQQWQLNPNQQSLNEWNWLIQWSSLLSLNTIVSILERTFFPKWLNVLYVWLNSGVANFQEISNWYQGWKTLMGNDLINHIIVKEFLRKALIMMDHAVNLETGLKSFISYYDPNVNIHNQQQQPSTTTATVPQTPQQPPPQSSIIDDQINFRQMIEMKAAENGIIFMPLANRFENGHQIFKFGSFLIYIDNRVIFQNRFQNGQRLWLPVALSDLLSNQV
ncbi:septin interacting protein 1 [Dermatophagoides pteronyssinus]|uniref:septin interacting protein 1 n=1 Tax=Dermatophagoides pteronyssinus TaxID=6956 RepID=UPI003F6690C8